MDCYCLRWRVNIFYKFNLLLIKSKIPQSYCDCHITCEKVATGSELFDDYIKC